MRRTGQNRQTGFTLVEVLVVAPMAIIIIGVLVAVVVNLTGSAMRSTAKAQLQNEIVGALDQIEQDVRLSMKIGDAGSHAIDLENLATNKNPLNPDRQLIRANDCVPAASGLLLDDAMRYTVHYRIDGGKKLVRELRVAHKPGCAGRERNVWQRTVTETLVQGSQVKLTVAPATSGAGHTNIIHATVSAERWVAGEKIEVSSQMYVKSSNIR